MPVSAIFYFQQADTVKQVPFNVEEEEPVKVTENPDTSTGKKELGPKTELTKKKKAVISDTSQKKNSSGYHSFAS